MEARIENIAALPDGGFEVIFTSPLFKAFAMVATEALRRTGPEFGNFLQAKLVDPKSMNVYSVVIQREGGLTPGEKMDRLYEVIEALYKIKSEPGPLTSEDELKDYLKAVNLYNRWKKPPQPVNT